MKRLDFINKRLRETWVAKVYINNTDDALQEYYQVFAKKMTPLLPEPQFSDLYYPLEEQKNVELLFVVAVDTGTPTNSLYR